MRHFDENLDLISLREINKPLAEELEKVIAHIKKDSFHVTPEDRIRWDNKLDSTSGDPATHETNGLMSAQDKLKLDGIQYNANFYEHPKVEVEPGTYNTVTVDRYGHVIDASTVDEVENSRKLGGKLAAEYALLTSPIFKGTPTLANTPTKDDTNAIANVRFVKEYVNEITLNDYGFTAEDINRWNNKWDSTNAPLATTSSNGIMSKADKNKLDQLYTNLNSVNKDDIDKWNSYESFNIDDIPLATAMNNGLMSKEDKDKLNGLSNPGYIVNQDDVDRWNNKWDATNAPVATEGQNGIITIEDRLFLNKLVPASSITEIDIRSWNNKLDDIANATQETDGLMSANDKKKLDQLSESYVEITEEDINRWNNKQSALSLVSQEHDGIMSSVDKTRLDNMYTNYDITVQKVTKAEQDLKTLSETLASSEKNGLMSSEDKTNLDSLYNKYSTGVSVSQTDVNRWNEAVPPETVLNAILRIQDLSSRVFKAEDYLRWKEYTDESGTTIQTPEEFEEVPLTADDFRNIEELLNSLESRVDTIEEHIEWDKMIDNDGNPIEDTTEPTTDPTEPTTDPSDNPTTDPVDNPDDDDEHKSLFDGDDTIDDDI